MKKALLFSLLLVFSSLFSFAQKITTDEILDNGVRVTICKTKNLDYANINGVLIGCNLFPDGECSYIILLSIFDDNIQISKGGKLLIDFSDGSKMELTNPAAKDPISSSVYYEISEPDMKQLVSKRITKIGIESDLGYIDQNIRDNELSNTLKQMYNNIQEALKSAPQDIPDIELSEYTLGGSKSLMCGPIILDYDATINTVQLSCIIANDGDIFYNIYLGCSAKNIRVSAGKKLLVKLGDGSIMEFSSYGEKQPTDKVIGYGYIPESEIEQLISKKITKIRVEYDSGYLDQDINDNELSNALKKLYDKIQEAITPIDIYSGF